MFEYSDTQFIKQYSLIKRWVTSMYSTTNTPNAYILGGQPGAGKTALQNLIRKNNKNIIVINADSFREFHPCFNEIQEQYGNDSPKYTQPFINHVTEKLIDELSAEKYNLIIEGTLRTANVPISTCLELKKKGYRVELHVMAVKRAISYESTVLRYENAIAQGEIPRATAKEHHDMVAEAIAENLDVIYQSKVFEDIKLFNRQGNCLYSISDKLLPSHIERKALDGEWSYGELHQLEEIVNRVRELKKNRNANDYDSYVQRTEKLLSSIIIPYEFLSVSKAEAEQLTQHGIQFEGKFAKETDNVIKINVVDKERANAVINQFRHSNNNGIKK